MSKQKLNAFLIKEGYNEFDQIMQMDSVEHIYDLRDDFPTEGKIYVGRNRSSSPGWLALLEQGSSNTLSTLTNSSTRAVLLIKRNNRIFAFPFGFGRFMTKDGVFVRDFGIKVVLNSVNPSKLRSVDTATFDELTIHSRTQTSRTASVNAFGIDIIRDLLRAVSGEPIDDYYGKVISGRESVQFVCDLIFDDLVQICDSLYEKYTDTSYKDSFEWFDNLQMINDPPLLQNLNNKLVAAINERDDNKFHMAPPEIIDWSDIAGFSFTEGGTLYDDLLVNDLFNHIQQAPVTIENLKRRHVFVKNSDTEVINKWKLFDTFIFETQHNGDSYILTIGSWFKIDRSFADQVRLYIESIPNDDTDLPSCRLREKEGQYNTRVGEESENIITLDRRNVYVEGNAIEICDLLTRDGKFIHVKPWNSSSTLSHLFAQGRVSAASMLQEESFQREALDMIKSIDEDYACFANGHDVRPNDLHVVFAIIDSDNRSLEDRLPFFSKLNMMHTVKYLRSMNVKVSKIKIVRQTM